MPHMLAQRPRLLELALGCLCCVGASGDARIPLISRRRSAACLVCSVRTAAISCFSSRLVGEAERKRERDGERDITMMARFSFFRRDGCEGHVPAFGKDLRDLSVEIRPFLRA